MIFVMMASNQSYMAPRSSSSSSTVLIVLVLMITFPFWIAFGAGLFGVIAGLFGVFFGVVAAFFGVIIGLIALPFKLIFGWGDHDWGWHFWPHSHHNGFFWLAIIIVVALVLQKKGKI